MNIFLSTQLSTQREPNPGNRARINPRRLTMKWKLLTLVLMTTAASLTPRAEGAIFGDDTAFLQAHTDVIVLTDKSGQGKVALAPAWQGRVMTSTAEGDGGASFGWINRELISSGKLQPHINVFGGEDRIWLGPEGGQFALFFAKGAKFEFSDWFTPAPMDTMPYKVASQSPDSARFVARFMLTNYSGTRFDVKVDRSVRVLEPGFAWKELGLEPVEGVKLVAYEGDNKIINAGPRAWKKDTGLLSIWILGQFNCSPGTTIVVPIKSGPESELGVKATSDYFGSVPPDRLVVKDEVIYLKADGKFRSKVGVNPRRSKKVLGSYDTDSHVLTIVQFSQPEGVTEFVNSLWKLQSNPYGGDVANSYNDGPPTPGAKPLGPFYELESSSPAAALAPGGSISHLHRTIHLTGSEEALDKVARSVLGVSLDDIKSAFAK
jgi:hypothetical protein